MRARGLLANPENTPLAATELRLAPVAPTGARAAQ
jgi:hypothetical protein